MSTRGIFFALSGALAQAQKLDTIANNLANVNTTGFKRDHQVFREYLSANEKAPPDIKVPRIPASIESFYDLQGGEQAFVDPVGTYTQFSQGSLQQTGNALDLAIEGQGFFEVMTPQGMRWTRAGNFKVDGNGILVTSQGHPVMAVDEGGQAPEERTLMLTGNGPIRISEIGEVFEGQNFVGRISVVQPQEPDAFQKVGNSYFDFRSNANAALVTVDVPNLRSGFLESSNVNIVQEMTDMIATTRVFESTQKAISAYDGIADKLVNQVPKV